MFVLLEKVIKDMDVKNKEGHTCYHYFSHNFHKEESNKHTLR